MTVEPTRKSTPAEGTPAEGKPAGDAAPGKADKGGGDGNERRTFTPDFLTELFRNPLDPGYAAAAERKARGAGPTGLTKKVTSGITALTLAVLGFLLVVAYQQTIADEPGRSRAHDELVDQVQNRRSDTGDLQNRADALRAEVATLRERELGGAAVARLRDLEAATGLAPVRGGGARITLTDGPTSIDPLTGNRKTEAQVKDTDLQLAANALWSNGAEAIAINGQRLTATSTIRQAGEAILVDFRPVSSPYEVVAIGPDDLADDFRDGYAGRFFLELVDLYGMTYAATEVDDVTLDAATELKLRLAKPSPDMSVAPGSFGSAGPGTSRTPGGTDPGNSPNPSEGG